MEVASWREIQRAKRWNVTIRNSGWTSKARNAWVGNFKVSEPSHRFHLEPQLRTQSSILSTQECSVRYPYETRKQADTTEEPSSTEERAFHRMQQEPHKPRCASENSLVNHVHWPSVVVVVVVVVSVVVAFPCVDLDWSKTPSHFSLTQPCGDYSSQLIVPPRQRPKQFSKQLDALKATTVNPWNCLRAAFSRRTVEQA